MYRGVYIYIYICVCVCREKQIYQYHLQIAEDTSPSRATVNPGEDLGFVCGERPSFAPFGSPLSGRGDGEQQV